MHAASFSGLRDGETYYKTQLEGINKERKALLERLEVVERENRDLRRTVYELTVSLGKGAAGQSLVAQNHQNVQAMDLEAALRLDGKVFADDEDGKAPDLVNFGCKVTLASHTGAVYAISFSPCGRFLVSGSFDKSLRIWSVEKPSDGPSTTILGAHDSNVVDVAWSSDSTLVFSGGYDKVVKEWDVSSSRDSPLSVYPCKGLVQAIALSRQNDDMIYVGTTANAIYCFDRRAPLGVDENVGSCPNDSMVNTIYLSNDSTMLSSGDSHGMIKTWDVRKMGPVPLSTTQNEVERRPITHVHANPAFPGEDEGRLLAVNSYDNYLRVYDRGERLLGASPSTMKTVHILRGGGNAARQETEDFEFAVEDDVLSYPKSSGISSSLLLATGSADGNVYLFDVSGGMGTGKTLQIMSGHQDRCYSVAFHPKEPILASCSADFSIKLWTPIKSPSVFV